MVGTKVTSCSLLFRENMQNNDDDDNNNVISIITMAIRRRGTSS
jgi:hypothetical protein